MILWFLCSVFYPIFFLIHTRNITFVQCIRLSGNCHIIYILIGTNHFKSVVVKCKWDYKKPNTLHCSISLYGFVDAWPPFILKVFVLLSDSFFNETLDCFSVQCDLSTVYEAMIQKLGSASALRVIWGSSCTVAQMTL